MSDHASDHAAHFVPLSVIMSDYDGALQTYMQRHDCQNVVVTMPVEMDVAGKSGQKFFAAVAVTMHFDSVEAIRDAVQEECPSQHDCVLAWVPADRFGHEDFGIYIEDIGVGDVLQEGLIAEIIDQAQIESAVTALGRS